MGMRVDIVTLFPEMCQQVLDASIIGRAARRGYIETHCHQIRDYTLNKQKQTDDYPYGGGCGMVLYAQPIADCLRAVQREVAERLAAPPGTKARGILSVLLQAWYDVEYLFTVSEGVFVPPPKVKSGVVRMRRNGVTDLGCDERLFKAVVKATFGQRRKTIRNSVKGLLPAGAPVPESPLMALRPEQLTVAQFIELTNLISQSR